MLECGVLFWPAWHYDVSQGICHISTTSTIPINVPLYREVVILLSHATPTESPADNLSTFLSFHITDRILLEYKVPSRADSNAKEYRSSSEKDRAESATRARYSRYATSGSDSPGWRDLDMVQRIGKQHYENTNIEN
jgi:hypothetical protein